MRARFISLLVIVMLLSIHTVSAQTALSALEPITAENAARLERLMRLGRGAAGEVAWSPDGDRLAITTRTGIWLYSGDDLDAAPILMTEGQSFPYYAPTLPTFSADGSLLAFTIFDAGYMPNTVAVWDVAGRRELRRFENATGSSFSPDGRWLEMGNYGQASWSLVDLAQGIEMAAIGTMDFAAWGNFLHFGADGTTFWTYSVNEGLLREWDIATRALLDSKQQTYAVDATLYSAVDDTYAVIQTSTKTMPSSFVPGEIVTVTTVTITIYPQGGPSVEIVQNLPIDISFTPDGRYLVGRDRGNVYLWDVQTGQLAAELNSVLSMAFRPGTSQAAVVAGNWRVLIWDAATDATIHTFDQHFGAVPDVAVSPDGTTLAGVSGDGMIVQWDVATGAELTRWEETGYSLHSVVYAPDGETLYVGGGDSFDYGVVTQRDSETGEVLGTINYDDEVLSLAISQNGATLAASLFDPPRDLPQSTVPNLKLAQWPGQQVALSPDGRLMAAAQWDFIPDDDVWGYVRLIDTVTEALVLDVPLEGWAHSVAFSPDGGRLAAGLGLVWDRGVQAARVWDIATKEVVFTTAEQPSPVSAVVFSSDGRLLATSTGQPGSFTSMSDISLWDGMTGTTVTSFPAHPYDILRLVFAPDDRLLIAASEDGTISVWGVPRGE